MSRLRLSNSRILQIYGFSLLATVITLGLYVNVGQNRSSFGSLTALMNVKYETSRTRLRIYDGNEESERKFDASLEESRGANVNMRIDQDTYKRNTNRKDEMKTITTTPLTMAIPPLLRPTKKGKVQPSPSSPPAIGFHYTILKPITSAGFNNVLMHVQKCFLDARRLEKQFADRGEKDRKGSFAWSLSLSL